MRNYAQRILQRYPHIYMFEVAREVRHEKLPGFINDMRRNFDAGFRIASFDFSDRRQWLNLAPRENYYPIIFIEPMYIESRPLMGLDLGSSPLFRRALEKSDRMNIPVASRPFTLLEGQRGFLLHRSVKPGHTGSQPTQYALLVIKAEELLPEELLERDELTARLYHREYNNDARDAELYYKPGRPAGELESRLFPRLQYERMVTNVGQPFVLSLEKQVRFHDVNIMLILAILIIGAISFWSMLVFSKLHHRHELERLQNENRLYRLANNDSLTGLANRNFLLDRMRQVLSKAKRKGTRFAVVFMDMNNFKMINDDFGHAAGDILLQDIAERFRDCMREEDIVCRYQGDEFVVLLDEISHRNETEQISEKLQKCLEAPFQVRGHEVYASVSVGIAVFPDDGETIEALMQMADQNMYREKKSA